MKKGLTKKGITLERKAVLFIVEMAVFFALVFIGSIGSVAAGNSVAATSAYVSIIIVLAVVGITIMALMLGLRIKGTKRRLSLAAILAIFAIVASIGSAAAAGIEVVIASIGNVWIYMAIVAVAMAVAFKGLGPPAGKLQQRLAVIADLKFVLCSGEKN
jgi:hypothetical protein